MTKMSHVIVMLVSTGLLACVTDDVGNEESSSSASSKGNKKLKASFTSHAHYVQHADGSFVEPVLVNGKVCDMFFYNTDSPESDVYAIWNIGVNSVADVSYPGPAGRAKLFAVFTVSSTALNHHVDGQDGFDHYHITDTSTNRNGGTLWDVYIVNPGPNYNAATYTVATSVSQMQAQIAAGILVEPILTTTAGLPPLVLNAPLICYDGGGHH